MAKFDEKGAAKALQEKWPTTPPGVSDSVCREIAKYLDKYWVIEDYHINGVCKSRGKAPLTFLSDEGFLSPVLFWQCQLYNEKTIMVARHIQEMPNSVICPYCISENKSWSLVSEHSYSAKNIVVKFEGPRDSRHLLIKKD